MIGVSRTPVQDVPYDTVTADAADPGTAVARITVFLGDAGGTGRDQSFLPSRRDGEHVPE